MSASCRLVSLAKLLLFCVAAVDVSGAVEAADAAVLVLLASIIEAGVVEGMPQ